MFLKESQNLEKMTRVRKDAPAQVFSCEFLEIPNNTFFYRTPLGNSFC